MLVEQAGCRLSHLTTWPWVFASVFITILVIRNFTTSTHGRACISVREDETAADSMGINTTYYKVVAFAIGAFFAGIAGGLYAHNFYIIQPSNFGFLKSFDILIFVVLGGLGSLSGSVLAAILLNDHNDIPSRLSRNTYDYLQSCVNYYDDLSSSRFNGNKRVNKFL